MSKWRGTADAGPHAQAPERQARGGSARPEGAGGKRLCPSLERQAADRKAPTGLAAAMADMRGGHPMTRYEEMRLRGRLFRRYWYLPRGSRHEVGPTDWLPSSS